ncbi:hypothetical protein [Luedemannella helvata]|uniref:Uncharacterized protein n=1 Tax=Luedemannella helvata TaxID=349315 RepID=A0ABP4VYD5_9ACTN
MPFQVTFVDAAPFPAIPGGTHALWRYRVTIDGQVTGRIGLGFSKLLDIRDPAKFTATDALRGMTVAVTSGAVQYVIADAAKIKGGRVEIAFVAPKATDQFTAVTLVSVPPVPAATGDGAPPVVTPKALLFSLTPDGTANLSQVLPGPAARAESASVVPHGILPYASEPFGVYQPLVGWRSALNHENLTAATASRFRRAVDLVGGAAPGLPPAPAPAPTPEPVGPSPRPIPTGPIVKLAGPPVTDRTGTAVGRDLAAHLAATEVPAHPREWQSLLSSHRDAPLTAITRNIVAGGPAAGRPAAGDEATMMMNLAAAAPEPPVGGTTREAAAASLLHYLGQTSPETVSTMFRATVPSWQRVLAAAEFFSTGHPATWAFLSPIGILHMFREYFFELGTFLGPPVGHVWISPGGTVELVEVNTRRTLTERTVEQSIETTDKSEVSQTDRDELSDAVKVENANDVRLGVTATGSGGVASIFQASASASFNMDSSRRQAQEQTHKHMREQSSKLSSEVRQNYKTTFRTVTETTDTSSRRYVLQNTTDRLVSYQLSRKMRKVAVQVQDLGQQLCWQLYVDNPGDTLGLGEFVHASSAAADPGVKPPDVKPYPAPIEKTHNLAIPFILYQGADDDAENTYARSKDNADHGIFVPDVGTDDIIQFKHSFTVPPPPPGMVLTRIGSIDFHGAQVSFTVDEAGLLPNPDPATNRFTIQLTHANFGGKQAIPFDVTLVYEATPQAKADIDKINADAKTAYNDEVAVKKEQLFYDTLRARLKLVSNVRPRPAVDLREEERNVIYRAVISRLYGKETGWSNDDYHVASELIRYLFDVDAMLYFVAPDWWRPRQQKLASKDNQGSLQPTIIAEPAVSDKVLWLGKRKPVVLPGHRPYYLITEETAPAPLGASLGWLIQLDGDAHRNAFLNSPWVKAVLPIRPGRERDAMAWLRRPEVAGTDGLDEAYPYDATQDPPEYNGATIAQVLLMIADKIQAEYQRSLTPVPVDDTVVNTQMALPAETVFANGFDPLEGGIAFGREPFEVFSQWIEILPTDQVVATEYDLNAQ